MKNKKWLQCIFRFLIVATGGIPYIKFMKLNLIDFFYISEGDGNVVYAILYAAGVVVASISTKNT